MWDNKGCATTWHTQKETVSVLLPLLCGVSVELWHLAVCFGSCTAAERKVLQRVINTAQKVIGCSLPPLEDIYKTRCLRKAHSILRDSTHPGCHLFELLPSGRRFRTIKAKTDRLRNSFYPRAIIAVDNAQNWPVLSLCCVICLVFL